MFLFYQLLRPPALQSRRLGEREALYPFNYEGARYSGLIIDKTKQTGKQKSGNKEVPKLIDRSPGKDGNGQINHATPDIGKG